MAAVARLRKSDLTWREVDGCAVLLDVRSSQFHELNRTGTVLWAVLADAPGGLPPSYLAEHLVRVYRIDRGTADGDVRIFLERLADLDLLEA